MIYKVLKGFVLLIITLLFCCCEKSEVDPKTETLVFPIGRVSFESNSYKVMVINDSVYTHTPKIIADSNNGYWLEFSRDDLEEFQMLQIQFTRKKQDLVLFHEESNNTSRWVLPSYYIDSDNEEIKAKAIELTKSSTSDFMKARQIHAFVCSHIRFVSDLGHTYFHKASTTLDLKKGNCMNFSRLFVALCRAANVPARTVWGIVYGYGSGSRANYNYHHQWAEILDQDNNWRVTDLTMTKVFDINDIRYLDLIYAAEENDMVRDHHLKEIMLDKLKYYNGYPAAPSGIEYNNGVGFNIMSDNEPDSLKTGYTYQYW